MMQKNNCQHSVNDYNIKNAIYQYNTSICKNKCQLEVNIAKNSDTDIHKLFIFAENINK